MQGYKSPSEAGKIAMLPLAAESPVPQDMQLKLAMLFVFDAVKELLGSVSIQDAMPCSEFAIVCIKFFDTDKRQLCALS